MTNKETIIHIDSVCKNFGKVQVLKDINLSIPAGEIFGLLGGNGAGKSTLISILTGSLLHTFGKITIHGMDRIKDIHQITKIINIVPQDTAIANNLTVKENLQFFSQLYWQDKNKAKAKVDELILQFMLDTVLDKQAKKLSGGMKRRLSVAIAFLSEPKILFLDEPTLGLDVLSRSYLWAIIEELKGKTTVVLTTHYLEEVQALCDNIAILADGKVRFTGTIAAALQQANTKKFEDAFLHFIKNNEGVV